jgi:hypothetical protein
MFIGVPYVDNINMDEIEQRCIVKFVWKENTNAYEIQQRLKAVYGDSSYALSTIYEWMRNFKLGRTKIHDFHRSGRAPIDHIDDDIMFLLCIFPFHTVRTLTETLNIGPNTILHHLHNSLGLKPCRFCRVPHELTCHLKEKRVTMCRDVSRCVTNCCNDCKLKKLLVLLR